ncbi:unnamed protein product [Paramecium sonneborni]|uniref:Uncharacterized protein n=1 Tax=Paramecium sonneborni TaxID=65129 RepID=A0A8S1LLU8_9CILI|nr:unnamed protein product [Paramecium sonneborni]
MGCSIQKAKSNHRDNFDQIEQLIQSECLSNEQKFRINNNPIVKRRIFNKEKKNLSASQQI